jgi:hypothetical protein
MSGEPPSINFAPGFARFLARGGEISLYSVRPTRLSLSYNMTPKETLANLALGVGMIANPALAHIEHRPMQSSAAIYSDFVMVGKYVQHGIQVTQMEVEDAKSREPTQLKFDTILAS